MFNSFVVYLGCILTAALAGCESYRVCEKGAWTTDTETVYVIDSSSINETPPADFVPTQEPPQFVNFIRPSYPIEILSTVEEKYKMWALMWIGNVK
jgi:hypothetical protein